MQQFKIGVIRVLSAPQDMVDVHGKLLERYYPAFRTVCACIPDQPEGVHDDETEAMAVPKVIALGKEMAGDVDAIVVSCAGDPGVEGLRAEVSVPVIGAGEATAFLATRYGSTFGVLGITEPPVAYRKYLGGRIVGPCKPEGVDTTLDLMTEEGRRAVFDTAVEIKNCGADAIAISCTGIGPLEISGEIQQHCGIPVIDPIQAEGLVAYYECLRLR